MSDLIGTVHKPQQPPIPEPEGWIVLEYSHSQGEWMIALPTILHASAADAEEVANDLCFECGEKPTARLVHIGPAPKVPVEAIYQLVKWAEEKDVCIDSKRIVSAWLSAQEEEDK